MSCTSSSQEAADIPGWLTTAAQLNGEAVFAIVRSGKGRGGAHLTLHRVGRVILEVRADKLAYLIEEPHLRAAWLQMAEARLIECLKEADLT